MCFSSHSKSPLCYDGEAAVLPGPSLFPERTDFTLCFITLKVMKALEVFIDAFLLIIHKLGFYAIINSHIRGTVELYARMTMAVMYNTLTNVLRRNLYCGYIYGTEASHYTSSLLILRQDLSGWLNCNHSRKYLTSSDVQQYTLAYLFTNCYLTPVRPTL